MDLLDSKHYRLASTKNYIHSLGVNPAGSYDEMRGRGLTPLCMTKTDDERDCAVGVSLARLGSC